MGYVARCQTWASGSATSTASLFIPHENVSIGGFLGGGRVGANYQAGPFVFGFEGDFTGMTLKGHTAASFTGTTNATSPFGGSATKVD